MIAARTRTAAAPPTAPARSAAPRPLPTGSSLAVIAVTLVIGAAVFAWSLASGLVLAPDDANTHLEIARQVLDSRTPGVAQLGTVWLPLPHLALLPLVQVDYLWRTGIAGSILGLLCLVVTGLAVFGSARVLTQSRVAAWAALVVVLTNLNALYVFTTALTEPVLLATMSVAAYYLIHWARATRSWQDLILAGAWTAAAVGSRYDGWAFAAAGTVAAVLAGGTGPRFRRARADASPLS